MGQANNSDSYFFVITFSTIKRIKSCLRESVNLSLNEFRMLGCLNSSISALPLIEIARKLDVPRSAISMDLSQLLEKKLCRRFFGPGGTRIRVAAITQDGKRVFEAAEDALTTLYDEIMSDLPETNRRITEQYLLMIADEFGMMRMTSSKIDVVLAFVDVSSRCKHIFTETIGKLGLSANEYCILNELADASQGLRPIELCGQLMISRATASKYCKRLEEKEYVVRARAPHDKKGVRFIITGLGINSFIRARTIYQAAFLSRVRNMTPEESDFFFDQNKYLVHRSDNW